MNEEIKKMKDQFYADCVNYAKLYRLALENILKEHGLFDVDVILKKSGKKGRLKIEQAGYTHSPFCQYLYFYPYKKDGTLSVKSCGCCSFLSERSLEAFEVAE